MSQMQNLIRGTVIDNLEITMDLMFLNFKVCGKHNLDTWVPDTEARDFTCSSQRAQVQESIKQVRV